MKCLAYYLSTLKTVLAGKCFRAYLRPLEDLWLRATVIYIYTAILEFDDKFKGFCEYVYLYIYMIPVISGYPANGHHTLGLS